MKSHPKEATFVSGDSNGEIKQWLLPKGELLNEFGTSQLLPNQRDNSRIINTLAINPVTNTLFSDMTMVNLNSTITLPVTCNNLENLPLWLALNNRQYMPQLLTCLV